MMGINSANAPALDLPARFMTLSIVSLLVAAVSAPWTLPLIQEHFSSFSLLAFIHLNTLGFIGAMLIGASYQLVPVAIQTQLASVCFGRISFWFYASGLVLFLISLTESWLPGIAAGGSLLGIAFALYIGVILTTWLKTPDRDVVSWHIALAVVNAGAGMGFGVALAFNKSNGMLGSRVLDLLAAHITLMLDGWVALTFFGVAYRLIGMFTLAEQQFVRRLAWAELALVVGGTWLLALRFAFSWPPLIGQIAGVMLLAGIACFVAQIARLYRRRLRRAIDVHMPFAIFAAVCAIAAGVLLVIAQLSSASPNDPIWVAIVWLMLFGVAETAIQGFFYKIATFLVWLKRYAPIAGAQTVPKLDELYSRRLALTGLGFWAVAIIGAAVAIQLELDALPVIGLVLLIGVSCFIGNVVMIARHWRRPAVHQTSNTRDPLHSPPLRTVTRH